MEQVVIKEGVKIKYLTQPMVRLFKAVFDTGYEDPKPVITSVMDGSHMRGSRHYTGLAIDLRTNNLSEVQASSWVERLKKNLGPNYDVILERDHIHAEYDPKTKEIT